MAKEKIIENYREYVVTLARKVNKPNKYYILVSDGYISHKKKYVTFYEGVHIFVEDTLSDLTQEFGYGDFKTAKLVYDLDPESLEEMIALLREHEA